MNYKIKKAYRVCLILIAVLFAPALRASQILKVEPIAKEGKPYFLVFVAKGPNESTQLQYKQESKGDWSDLSVNSSQVLVGPCKEGERYDFKTTEDAQIHKSLSSTVFESIESQEEIGKNYFHHLGEREVVSSAEDEILLSFRELVSGGYTYFELIDRHQFVVQVFALANAGITQYVKLPIKELALRTDEIYTFKKKYSNGRLDRLKIKRLDASDLDTDLDVKINPLPIISSCEDGSNNHIEFIVDIEEGGVAPYEIRWVVFEGSSQYSYLHDPVEQTVQLTSEVPKLTVTDPLGYGVYFFVKDACKKSGEAYLYVGCKEEKKKQNVLFFDINTQGDKGLGNTAR